MTEPKVTKADFFQLVCSALSGVCASKDIKFGCTSQLEIARTAISIAKHVVDELEASEPA